MCSSKIVIGCLHLNGDDKDTDRHKDELDGQDQKDVKDELFAHVPLGATHFAWTCLSQAHCSESCMGHRVCLLNKFSVTLATLDYTCGHCRIALHGSQKHQSKAFR